GRHEGRRRRAAAIAHQGTFDRHRASRGRDVQRTRRRSDRARCHLERLVHLPQAGALPADGQRISMIRRLLAILGRRTILTFGLVTFLVGALLATVHVTSRYALARPAREGRTPGGSSSRGAIHALVGPEYAMGKAFLALQGAKDFTLQVHVRDEPRFLFNTPLTSVVRLDRDELNRWLMDQTG